MCIMRNMVNQPAAAATTADLVPPGLANRLPRRCNFRLRFVCDDAMERIPGALFMPSNERRLPRSRPFDVFASLL